MGWRTHLKTMLNERKHAGLWRQPGVAEPEQLNFCSNDYLSLSRHPKVIATYQQGLSSYGTGSGGSPLISGYQSSHHALSEKLADWLGRDKVLLTSSGYAANHAVVAALHKLKPRYIFDKRNHASMYDAVQSGNNPLVRFKHNDLAQAAHLIPADSQQLQVLASEGVFSMDGDAVPLHELIALRRSHPGTLLTWIDDAHGIGVSGPQGKGIAGQSQQPDIDIITATFGKAFGMHGAFVAGSDELIEACWQYARHYIYSTAFSAAQADALSCAMDILAEEPQHRQHLEENITYFKQGLVSSGWRSEQANGSYNHAIQPIHCGSVEAALQLSERLQNAGIHCMAIRPPTVPLKQAGVRITLNAGHSKTQIDQLLTALGSNTTGNNTTVQEQADAGE